MLYDVAIWNNAHGWRTVLRAVSLIEAEGYEGRHPRARVSIMPSLWADVPADMRPDTKGA